MAFLRFLHEDLLGCGIAKLLGNDSVKTLLLRTCESSGETAFVSLGSEIRQIRHCPEFTSVCANSRFLDITVLKRFDAGTVGVLFRLREDKDMRKKMPNFCAEVCHRYACGWICQEMVCCDSFNTGQRSWI